MFTKQTLYTPLSLDVNANEPDAASLRWYSGRYDGFTTCNQCMRSAPRRPSRHPRHAHGARI
jgi:hypothetical protein